MTNFINNIKTWGMPKMKTRSLRTIARHRKLNSRYRRGPTSRLWVCLFGYALLTCPPKLSRKQRRRFPMLDATTQLGLRNPDPTRFFGTIMVKPSQYFGRNLQLMPTRLEQPKEDSNDQTPT